MTRHFCFCFSLKIGAIIMSFLNLLEGGLEVIVSIIELSDLESKDKFKNLTRHVHIVEKVCNATNFCNETTLRNHFPTEEPGVEGHITLFTVCLVLGMLTLFNGVLLLTGLLQAKEKYILWYVLLGSITLFIVTIYTGIYMFHNQVLIIIFAISLFMCYGQLGMYYFYEEIAEYNTVKSGVIEISYNADPNSYVNSGVPPNEPTDNTAV